MAVVHNTTLVPSKLELLAPWLLTQPWYRSAGPAELSRAGGFRLDDPAGEVGIELMVVNDASGVNPMSYFKIYIIQCTQKQENTYRNS